MVLLLLWVGFVRVGKRGVFVRLCGNTFSPPGYAVGGGPVRWALSTRMYTSLTFLFSSLVAVVVASSPSVAVVVVATSSLVVSSSSSVAVVVVVASSASSKRSVFATNALQELPLPM